MSLLCLLPQNFFLNRFGKVFFFVRYVIPFDVCEISASFFDVQIIVQYIHEDMLRVYHTKNINFFEFSSKRIPWVKVVKYLVSSFF